MDQSEITRWRSMLHAPKEKELCKRFWRENLEEKHNLENLDLDNRILLIWIFKK
jgi:hypothetical protein